MTPSTDIPDIRDIVSPGAVSDPSYSVVLAVFVGLTLGGALAGALIFLVLRSRRIIPPPMPLPARDVALHSLARLRKKAGDMTPVEITREIDQILDIYMHRRFGVPALYRTADELTRDRSADSPPPLPQLRPFAPLLEKLENARFAKEPPMEKGGTVSLLDEATHLIEHQMTTPPPAVVT